MIKHFESQNELSTGLDIYRQYQSAIYSINIGILNKDDILSISGQFEATNPFKYNCMCGRYLKLTHSGGAIYLSRPFTENITPDMHHGAIVLARHYKVPYDLQDVKIHLIAYAGADRSKFGDMLKIEQNYGHLDCLVFSNE